MRKWNLGTKFRSQRIQWIHDKYFQWTIPPFTSINQISRGVTVHRWKVPLPFSFSLNLPFFLIIKYSYVDKFTQFTSLFVSLHLRRVEKNSSFPIIEFLSLLYQYTFMQTSLEGFLSCLEIWETFLDYIISEHEANRVSSLHERFIALFLYFFCGFYWLILH